MLIYTQYINIYVTRHSDAAKMPICGYQLQMQLFATRLRLLVFSGAHQRLQQLKSKIHTPIYPRKIPPQRLQFTAKQVRFAV